MMTQAQLATASLNDIVFDGRNKEYGAYELRAMYDRNVMRALAWASLILLLLIAFPLIARLVEDRFPVEVVKPTGVVTLINPPLVPDHVIVPPVAPPPVAPPAASQPKPTTVRYTEFVAAKDETVTDNDIPNQADLVDANVGTVTFKGGDSDALPTDLPIGPGNDVVSDVVAKPTVYYSVERMPEAMAGGGLMSIVAAIQKAVHYPAIDLRNGIEGKVFASFIVNSAGEITEVKIVRGLSSTLDAETLRAIGTLPKLIPGRQNGQAVNVGFTVPISFSIR